MPFIVDEEQIGELRTQFLRRASQSPELYHEKDIRNVKESDWTVKRFLYYNENDMDKSLEHMDNAMRWRKEYGVNDKTEADLPYEFVTAGAVFPGYEDNRGRIMIFFRVKVNRKIPELQDYFRQFVIGVINRVDEATGESGYGFVFDISGVGYKNVDLDFIQFLISTVRLAFPCGMRLLIAYNVPRLLRPLWSGIKLMFGQHARFVKFANGKEILKYIPAKGVPKYMGGDNGEDFTRPPPGVELKSVREFAPQYGFTEADVKKYMEMFEKDVKEAYQLVHNS